MTNDFEENQLVASYIMPDGKLKAGVTLSTHGKGGASNNNANDSLPIINHTDPGLSSGTVTVVGDQVLVANIGSNTFSAFDINPADPARPTFVATYPTIFEFPNSIAGSADGKYACVTSIGAKNGIACFEASHGGWEHIPAWDRDFGFNLTTPPHGPFSGTPSDITFARDFSALYVSVKGFMPTDANNPTPGTLVPGSIYRYAITSSSDKPMLADKPVITPAHGSPFTVLQDLVSPNVLFAADPTAGYEAFSFEATNGTGTGVQGTIPGNQASCWAVQSANTGSFYTIDAGGTSLITEISVDPKTLNGTVLHQRSLGNNSAGTDSAIFTADSHKGKAHGHEWLYVLAGGYKSVHVFKIGGVRKLELIQRYRLSDMPKHTTPTAGFAGQAVYNKLK